MWTRAIAMTITVALATAAAMAQSDRTIDVRFPAGETGTTLNDRIVGRDALLYKVGAEAGQRMDVSLSASNTATYFNIYAPGSGPGGEAMVIGELQDPLNTYSGVLPASGEYTISVFLYRSAARRGETSDVTLDISIDGATGDQVQGDFADGLAGGPDFLAVATKGGGTLNLRAAPSSGALIVARLSNGENVRNLGCRMAEGGRWCNVATLADPGHEGWASGDFLVEGSGVAVQLPEPVAQAGGTSTQRVRFAAGTTGAELRASLAPGESRRYVIGASSGQDLYVRVAPDGARISYQIFNPDNSFLLDQVTSDREYRGELWQSGDHVVEVINRTNQTASYNVIVGID